MLSTDWSKISKSKRNLQFYILDYKLHLLKINILFKMGNKIIFIVKKMKMKDFPRLIKS